MFSQRIFVDLDAGSALVVTVALVIVAVGSAPSTASAAPQKTMICHFNADNDPGVPDWELLSTGGGRSLERHFAHGDGLPGGNVPNTDGQAVFDARCGVVIIDQDGDGVLDEEDNCPTVSNPDQSNRYGSTKGDACEDDYNDNGIVDTEEDWMCVSIDGVVVLLRNTVPVDPNDPWCITTPSTGDTSNVAISTGAYVPSTASLGNGNIAIAENTSVGVPDAAVEATASDRKSVV